MARTQTLVQLTPDLLAELDVQAARTGRNRSDLIREAVTSYLGLDRNAEVDRQIVEAYTQQPQEDSDLALATANALAMVDAEPWD